MLVLSTAPAAADPALWVPSAPIRRYVQHLISEVGVPWRVIACQADVPAAVVRTLLFGRSGRLRPKLEREMARRLLSITAPGLDSLRRHLVDTGETRRRIRRLLEAGAALPAVARCLGLSEPACQRLADGRQWYCSAWVEALARAACEAHGVDAAIGKRLREAYGRTPAPLGSC
ncbi:MAG: hypothetical protein LBI84_09905 [Propionibacteriaceae bacterium]|jgi:hypothetical protein|nr:hypothetical protein [Propionibacteriaceae bacterium]